MKTETTETHSYTVTTYFCDVGERHALLAGKRPFVCPVCQREVCAYHLETLEDVTLICSPCAAITHCKERFERLGAVHKRQVARLFERWKVASLRQSCLTESGRRRASAGKSL